MSSGFTSGGSLETPIERDDEWLKAQSELDQERARKAEIERQQGGKSLYEVLQANKAAKQEQFEESIKLKNQFRTLDDDEIDFLDSVVEKERLREAAVKKETEEQLQSFAKAQNDEESQSKLREPDVTQFDETPDWSVRPKRKRQEKEGLRGLKFSKTTTEQSSPIDKQITPRTTGSNQAQKTGPIEKASEPTLAVDESAEARSSTKSNGLVIYESSDDSDEE